MNDALYWGNGIRGGFEKGNLCFGNLRMRENPLNYQVKGVCRQFKYVNHQLEEKWGLQTMGLQ